MHWRGDRTSASDPLDEDAAFKAFNVAFDGLIGRGSQIPAGDMDAFTDFILQVVLPPNPVRPLDGIPVGSPAAQGRTQFLDSSDKTDLVEHCAGCHALDPAQGFFGTDGFMSFENETQDFKIPHLRNLYQKVGMFGMPRSPFIKNGNNGDQGPQVRGFGFLHDGSIDTLFRFHRAQVFNLDVTHAQNMEQFMFQFDSNLAPIVGQQVTRTDTSPGSVDTRINLLLARDDANECEVVVKGPLAGEQRGWYHQASGLFRSDLASEPLRTATFIHDEASSPGQERTYTCVPVGSGERIGVDRDLDGCFDTDELRNGSDPADPASNGCPNSTTTTTTISGSTTTTTLPPLCGPLPAVGCRAATALKSSVVLKNNPDDKRDVLRWTWRGGATATANFKDPLNGSAGYRFCVYDGSGASQPLLQAAVLPGGTCGTRPCWKATGTTGFRMWDRGATPSGLTRVRLKESIAAPRAKVFAYGKGVNLSMPTLALTLPVTVQLLIDGGGGPECWQTVYTTVRRSDGTQFRAKGP
jgi:hypothetical protein